MSVEIQHINEQYYWADISPYLSKLYRIDPDNTYNFVVAEVRYSQDRGRYEYWIRGENLMFDPKFDDRIAAKEKVLADIIARRLTN